jgi:hypothetical protein
MQGRITVLPMVSLRRSGGRTSLVAARIRDRYDLAPYGGRRWPAQSWKESWNR